MQLLPGPPIRYTARVKGEDDDLDRLRDHISRIIALRMREQLQARQPVTWSSAGRSSKLNGCG